MKNENIIENTKEFVRAKLTNECTGHDWWHIYRVWQGASLLAKQEHANKFIVQLAALLHDIADWKFHEGNDKIGPKIARDWLVKSHVKIDIIDHVVEIINDITFKGANVESKMRTVEGEIVQDADRLDAIGAIGIARTFAYGGYKGRVIYDPFVTPNLHDSFEKYKSNTSPTINHFYEKLLLLKDRMNTTTAKVIAQKRHRFMKQYLKHFFDEWNGKA